MRLVWGSIPGMTRAGANNACSCPRPTHPSVSETQPGSHKSGYLLLAADLSTDRLSLTPASGSGQILLVPVAPSGAWCPVLTAAVLTAATEL